MHTKEALQTLRLKEGANQDEVKAAFRDMVKVWHPDRFGSDPRLREKAEQALKDINDAYRALRERGTDVRVPPPDSEPSSNPNADWTPHSPYTHKRSALAAWILYGCVGCLLVAMTTYAFVLVRSTNQRITGMLAAAPAPSSAATAPHFRTPKQAPAAQPKHPRTSSLQSEASAAAPFDVLSETETAQVEKACSRKRHVASAYAACIRAALARIRRYETGASGLTAEEQDSLTGTCATEAARNDDAGRARCVAFYKEELTSAADRPNMAALNETDRNAASAACAKSKSEGPVSYDRCLMRFVRLLAR